jgi:D-alanyl-D-alanine carboxypeptidase
MRNLLIAYLFVAVLPKEQFFLSAYRDVLTKIEHNKVWFSSGHSMVFDDGISKNKQELLDKPDIEDQLHYKYNRGLSASNTDAGRIRNEAFFKEIYGKTQAEVSKNLKSLQWCPKLVKNGAYEALKRVSQELDKHPEWKKYLTNVGGTFNWRNISGTNRLSSHSFGITIDINTTYSNYWQWDCGCKNEGATLKYRNQIPLALVAVFEENGFIWGGRWLHYDTMHFEYRPEFFVA